MVDDLPSPLLTPPEPNFDEHFVPVEEDFNADGAIIWDVVTPWQAPLGFSGPSGVLPSEGQTSPHFVPVEDRWRVGLPRWDRYGEDHSVLPYGDPFEEDNPYVEGAIWNPFNQNVLKGDYPIVGQHTFLNFTATSFAAVETRQVPTATTPFESTDDPFSEEFFGNPNQFFYRHDFRLTIDLFHGDAAFKPVDWRIKFTPIFNINYLDVEELAVVNPDVRKGTTRDKDFVALEECFLETKLKDTSPYYDFTSVRGGSQFFTSDFRGFIFADINRSVRLFGSRHANRDQFNVIWFDQWEKDTNSQLNSFEDRFQNTFIANYYRQDFIWPGYTAQLSFHYNNDEPTMHFDKNNFLVRPDPVGIFQKHRIESYYFGWAGDGHINRYNISHAFYWVTGRDSLNPLAGHELDINAQMVAIELSYDRDWIRFRSSFFWASGDDDINDGQGEGFDAIFDSPNFAGGEFSYWQRQAVRLFGVNLTNNRSIVPHLRSSKTEGQTNFVNPGLILVNLGADVELTPRWRLVNNINALWFDRTDVLEQFAFQADIDQFIGIDASIGTEYRPLHNDNIIIVAGVSALFPGEGFDDLFSNLDDDASTMFASFIEIIATF